jgi:hypothetical protein
MFLVLSDNDKLHFEVGNFDGAKEHIHSLKNFRGEVETINVIVIIHTNDGVTDCALEARDEGRKELLLFFV